MAKKTTQPAREPFEIRRVSVPPGTRRTVQLRVARLYDHTPTAIPVHVVHGAKPGPTLFLSAAIHGDELNGIEIIQRVLKMKALNSLRGTLLAIPIVNVFGFNTQSRYLPDRRDLNRCFPGSRNGSLASRLAHIFLREIVQRCDCGIDLHTGAIHRTNLPQIRGNLEDAKVKRLAEVFAAPVMMNSELRDGSLRDAAKDLGVPVLLYEAGEALRFDEAAIRTGLAGVRAVMMDLGMLPPRVAKQRRRRTFTALGSHWIRASRSGVLRTRRKPGDQVQADDILGVLSGPIGERPLTIRAREEGIIIGQSRLPVASAGDALFHIATFRNADAVSEHIDESLYPMTSGAPGI